MTLYMENPKEFTIELLELIKNLAGLQDNQFLYTRNKHSKKTKKQK